MILILAGGGSGVQSFGPSPWVGQSEIIEGNEMSESEMKAVEIYSEPKESPHQFEFGWFFGHQPYVPDGALGYEDVESAENALAAARESLVQAEKAYLFSHGFKIVTNHDKETVGWVAHEKNGGRTYSRKCAVSFAKTTAQGAKWAAEQEIKSLKAKHGIEDGGAK